VKITVKVEVKMPLNVYGILFRRLLFQRFLL